MSDPRPFDFRELSGADDGGDDAGLGQALSAARAIEASLRGPDPRPSAGLADRIMAAVAREPAPHAVGILAALRRRPGLGGLADSLRLAWSRAMGAGRPMGLRFGALAYVAAVAVLAVSLSGVAAYATAGVLGLFGPPASHAPDATQPNPTLGPVSPMPTELESAEPSESPEASETAEPSDDHDSPEPGDDDGGAAAPGATDEHDGDAESNGSSESATQTPRPSPTPDEETHSTSDG